jgi:hypothetical protein
MRGDMKKMTSFQRDSSGEYAGLFLEVRDFIKACIGSDAKEKYSDNITTLYSREGGFCYIRVKEDYIHIGWFRGRHIHDRYKVLFGTGKTIRGQKVYRLDQPTRDAIQHHIHETLLFLFEHNELQKLKNRKI